MSFIIHVVISYGTLFNFSLDASVNVPCLIDKYHMGDAFEHMGLYELNKCSIEI
jgi:hypothetical protein